MTQKNSSLIRFSTDNPLNQNDDLYYYDEVEAERYCWFIENLCTHVEGDLTGQPIELDWFWGRSIREFMGTRRKEDNLRRYIFGDWRVPRGNFKSGIHMAWDLAILALDRPGTRKQGFVCASTEDQSWKTFRMMKLMIEQNDDLLDLFEPCDSYILHRETESLYLPMTSAIKGQVGTNPHLMTWEEKQEQENKKLISQVETGAVKRKDPIIKSIGTAGDKPYKENAGYAEYVRAKEIIEGKQKNDSYYCVLAEAPDGCDPGDEEIWKAVNPLWNISVNARMMRELYEKAKDDETQLKEFKQYNLNIWQKQTSQFISMPKWNALHEDYTENSLEGRDCIGGLDLGDSYDMSAFYLLFPFWSWTDGVDDDLKPIKIPDAEFKQLVWYWIPEGAVEQAKGKGVDYKEWEAQGLLEITSGDTVDRALIKRRIVELKRKFRISAIGYDPYLSSEMVQLLQDVHKIPMIKIVQSCNSLGEPTKLFKELVNGGKIRHNKNAIFDWNLTNSRTIKNRSGHEMVSSEHSRGDNGSGKCDGTSAMSGALKVHLTTPPPKPKRKIHIIG